MSKRYVVINESAARERKLPGYEEEQTDRFCGDSGWALFECDDAGAPIRHVFADRMEPEDAILVRDLRPLVAELNAIAARCDASDRLVSRLRSRLARVCRWASHEVIGWHLGRNGKMHVYGRAWSRRVPGGRRNER